MIGMTLICVVLGGLMARVEYLRRWAAFHQSETVRSREEMKRREKILLDAIGELSDTPTTWDATAKWQFKKDTAQADFDEATAAFKLHRDLESKYSRAVYRPWMLVSEPTP